MGKGLFPYPLTAKTVHLCLDMQRIFAPEGPWATPWMERVLPLLATRARLGFPVWVIFPASRPRELPGGPFHDARHGAASMAGLSFAPYAPTA